MLDLIARLEAAQEGSLLLNKEILRELGYTWRGMDYWHADNKQMWKGSVDFTSSIDAALTLVPASCWARVQTATRDTRPIAWVSDEHEEDVSETVEGATPAIALCIAALKARHAQSLSITNHDQKSGDLA